MEDTWVKIKTQEVDAFMEHLNSVESSIKFKREGMKENRLPFLDYVIHLERNGNSALKSTRNLLTQSSTCFSSHTTF